LKKSKNYIKKGIYFLILAVLIVPYIQKREGFIKVEKLNGSFEKKEIKVPPLQLKTYQTEEFQRNYKERYKEEFGFKNTLIRVHNQLNYSLFDVANSRGVIVADDNVMMPGGYIKSYLGVDVASREKIEIAVKKARAVQDSLKKKGKAFFFLIAPGKASVYPEKIPEYFFIDYPKKASNYEIFTELLIKYKVNYIDFRKYVVENKAKFKYPIFPSMGIHWSGNTVAIAMDSMLSYIENQHHVPIQQISLSEGEKTVKNYRYTDYDIGESMNLLWFSSRDTLHYPSITYEEFDKKKPKILGVGDSFIESFMGFYDIIDTCFSTDSRIWFYNRIIDWPKNLHGIEVPKLDLSIELANKDVVFVETSEENIRMLGYSFIEDLDDYFTGKDQIPKDLESYYLNLLKNPKVLNEAKGLSNLLGYSIEEATRSLAKYELEKLPLADFDFEKEVAYQITQIKKNKKWLDLVKKQAIQKNIPLDENIRANAVWMVNESLGKN